MFIVYLNVNFFFNVEELSGIFVKSISEGSAADLCKKIQVNDRSNNVYYENNYKYHINTFIILI